MASRSSGERGKQRQTASQSMRFNRVTQNTLRHVVLEPIRNAILFGQIAVGQRLMETEIAEQMGVSRVPVREALQQLAQEGLVETYPHRGTVVAAVDEDEVDILYRLRAELEGAALRILLARGGLDLGPTLQSMVDTMRRSVQEGNLGGLAEKDLDFHRHIVSTSGYRTLARVWESMDGPIRARLYRSFAGPHHEELIQYTAESHQPVVDAITSEDPEVAVRALQHHILVTRSVIEEGVSIDE